MRKKNIKPTLIRQICRLNDNGLQRSRHVFVVVLQMKLFLQMCQRTVVHRRIFMRVSGRHVSGRRNTRGPGRFPSVLVAARNV